MRNGRLQCRLTLRPETFSAPSFPSFPEAKDSSESDLFHFCVSLRRNCFLPTTPHITQPFLMLFFKVAFLTNFQNKATLVKWKFLSNTYAFDSWTCWRVGKHFSTYSNSKCLFRGPICRSRNVCAQGKKGKNTLSVFIRGTLSSCVTNFFLEFV